MELWVAESKRLLGLERDAEIEQRTTTLQESKDEDLEARGLSLLSLKLDSVSTGMFGRTSAALVDWRGRLLPSHQFSVGDIVGIRAAHGGSGAVKHDVTGQARCGCIAYTRTSC